MCWGGNGWMWSHGWGGGWLIFALILTLFLAVVITGVVVAMRYQRPGGTGAGVQPTPNATAAEDVLAHRFARGEIDETEFSQRSIALKEHRGS